MHPLDRVPDRGWKKGINHGGDVVVAFFRSDSLFLMIGVRRVIRFLRREGGPSCNLGISKRDRRFAYYLHLFYIV
jgi:hypothetical protein